MPLLAQRRVGLSNDFGNSRSSFSRKPSAVVTMHVEGLFEGLTTGPAFVVFGVTLPEDWPLPVFCGEFVGVGRCDWEACRRRTTTPAPIPIVAASRRSFSAPNRLRL